MSQQSPSHPPRPPDRQGAPRRTRPGQWVLLVLGALLTALGLVLLGLVGGSLPYFVAEKTVTLTIDGQSREVST